MRLIVSAVSISLFNWLAADRFMTRAEVCQRRQFWYLTYFTPINTMIMIIMIHDFSSRTERCRTDFTLARLCAWRRRRTRLLLRLCATAASHPHLSTFDNRRNVAAPRTHRPSEARGRQQTEPRARNEVPN